jgi:hypothetical protein
LFPAPAQLDADSDEPLWRCWYRPLCLACEQGLRRLAFLQHGRTNFYVLYIAVTLLVLLWWAAGRGS